MQREQQNKLMDEMFSPLCSSVLPASIEERLILYAKRNELEDLQKPYKIIKHKFLNYRLLHFQLFQKKHEPLAAHILSYSTLSRTHAQGKIEFSINGIYYFNREEIRFITLEYYNNFFQTNYSSITELIYKPQSYEDEQKLREHITTSNYDLTPIIVINETPHGKYRLSLESKVYQDTREKLIVL
jgi:hypothetical protein